MQSLELIQFTPNVPLQLTLKPGIEPLQLPHGAGSLYTLTDGRLLHLAGSQADSLRRLNLEPGESFRICFYQQAGGIGSWSVWLSPETEKARGAAETPELEQQLAASLELVGRRKYPDIPTVAPKTSKTPLESPYPLAPTGTEGGAVPAVQRKPAIAAVAGSKRDKPGPIPLNVAFREIVRFVCAELNASGEQWSENSRQDMISTVIISAQKLNLLGGWERENAA